MQGLGKLLLFAFVLCWWGGSASEAFAQATCWCEIDSIGGSNVSQLDLTSAVNTRYDDCLVDPLIRTAECDWNLADCSRRCNVACGPYKRSQSFANTLCARGIANGTVLKCQSHVGTSKWQTNDTVGTLTNIPAVSNTVCTCPKPWLNVNNVEGGTSPDKQCKIMVCSPITPGPGSSMPPNGTATNTWPTQWWTWENTLWQWAPVATCATTQVSPAQCKLD
jgi:hypothetical protein